MKSLFNLSLRRIKNGIKHFGPKKYLIFALFGLAILLLMVFFFIKIFSFLYYQPDFPQYFKLFLGEKILLMVFMTLFVMLIMSALVSTLNIFFLSKDLNLLLSTPLSVGSVFSWKATEVFFNSAVMVLFFSFPALFAYCYYFAAAIDKIVAILGTFFLFLFCGVSIGILIGIVIPAFFSVKKLQPVLSVISILLISAVVIFLRLLRPEQFGNPDIINNLMEYMGGLKLEGLSLFPFYWMSRAVNLVSVDNFSDFWQIFALFLVIVALLAAVIWILQRRIYLPLVEKLGKGSLRGKPSHWSTARHAGGFGSLWQKEVKTFFRSPAQWSQLVIVLAIVVVYVINMREIPLPHSSLKIIVAYLNLGMAAFIVLGLHSRFTFTSLPGERPGVVHILGSPFERKRVLLFKLLFYGIPQMMLGLILFVASEMTLQLDTFMLAGGLVYLIPVLILLSVLALYFGLAVDPRVPLSPQHLIVSRQGIAFMLWGLVYIILSLIYFIRPFFLFYYSRHIGQPVHWTEIAIWFGGFWLLHFVVVWMLLKKMIRLWVHQDYL
jgi:ABC-2 type transport system permease protein